jgi:hypothetical protein
MGGGQGSNNKLIRCGVSWAYAPGPNGEEERKTERKTEDGMTGVIIWRKSTINNNKERWTTIKQQEKMTCQESFY